MPVHVGRGAQPRRWRHKVAAAIAVSTVFSLFCSAFVVAAEPAAPAAPSNGQRAKASDGSDVIFDGVFGAYAVPGQVRTYWVGDRFYRYLKGIWLGAPAAAGPWETLASALVPEPLRNAFARPKERERVTLPSGLVAVYEPGLRIFAVADQPDLYLLDGRFLRYSSGVWLVSASQTGPWEFAPLKGIPQLLLRKVKPPEPGDRVTVPSGPVLEYDGDLALFRVVDKPDVYFRNGVFFERRDSKWFTSNRPEAGFEEISAAKAPAPLRAYYRRKEAGDDAAKVEKKKPGAGGKQAGQGKDAAGRAAGRDPGTAKKAGAKSGAPKAKAAGDGSKPGHDRQGTGQDAADDQ